MNYEPNTREKLQIALNNYRMFGAWQTFKGIANYLLGDTITDHFDQRYGVATGGYVEAFDADIGDDVALTHAMKYLPIPEQTMRHILSVALKDRDPAAHTFVDLGCGKGRALLIAAGEPFKRILGVEISPSHCELARTNIATYLASSRSQPLLRCRDLTVVCASAPDARLPEDSDLLIYMLRPFIGLIFEQTLESIATFRTRTGRQVTIVLCCPREEYLLDRHPAFRKALEYQVINDEYSFVIWNAV